MVKNNSITTYLNKNKWRKTFKSLSSKSFTLLLTALLTLGIFTVNINNQTVTVYADDLVNTVPTEESPTGSFYSSTINTGLGNNGPGTLTPDKVKYKGYGPNYGTYNVAGVYQSLSTLSPTSFAAGLPLGTIFIDQEMVNTKRYEVVAEIVSKNPAIIAGLDVNVARIVDNIQTTNTVGYDGTKQGAIPMVPGKINELNGDLFKVTFANAAVLPNGDRADLVITYSNARIVIDERYMAAPDGLTYYEVKRCADEKNINPVPTPMTRVTGDTYDDYPVYKGSNGFLYYLKN